MAPYRDGYVHDGLLFDSDAQLEEIGSTFLAEGLQRGEQVLLVRDRHRPGDPFGGLLAHVTEPDRVLLVDIRDTYSHVPGAVDFHRQLATRARLDGAPRARVLGANPFGDDPRTWHQWERYEAVCNVALAHLSLWSLCAYDVRTTPARVLDVVHQTHPYLREGADRVMSPAYVDPVEFLLAHQPPLPEVSRADLLVTGLRTQVDVRRARRRMVRTVEDSRAVSATVVDDLDLALGELCANALQHGRPPVTLGLWSGTDEVTCTVGDAGPGVSDHLAGYWRELRTADGALPPSGLWLARQLVDELTFHHGPEGFTARVRVEGRA